MLEENNNNNNIGYQNNYKKGDYIPHLEQIRGPDKLLQVISTRIVYKVDVSPVSPSPVANGASTSRVASNSSNVLLSALAATVGWTNNNFGEARDGSLWLCVITIVCRYILNVTKASVQVLSIDHIKCSGGTQHRDNHVGTNQIRTESTVIQQTDRKWNSPQIPLPIKYKDNEPLPI